RSPARPQAHGRGRAPGGGRRAQRGRRLARYGAVAERRPPRLRPIRCCAGSRLYPRRSQCDPARHLTRRRAGRIGAPVAESSASAFGRYTLVERLAIGGMAELFLATAPGEHGFQKRVVIKRLLAHLAREPVYTAMFIDEAKLTARLVHPKIAQT